MTHTRLFCSACLLLLGLAACGDDATNSNDPDAGAEVGADTAADSEVALDVGVDGADADHELVTAEESIIVAPFFADSETVEPMEGLTVCVFEFEDTLPCGTTDDEGRVQLQVPTTGRFHLHVSGGDTIPTLTALDRTQVRTDDETDIFALSATATAIAEARADAGVEGSDTLGSLLVINATSARDPAAFTGVVAEIGAGVAAVYTNDEGHLDPTLAATGEAGGIAFLNTEPGLTTLSLTHPRSPCTAAFGGAWSTEGAPGEFEAHTEAGMVTFNLIKCDDFELLDDQQCDVIAQDCADESRSKCRVTIFAGVGSRDAAGTECVAEGAALLAEPCTRRNGDAGDDDCAAGLYCANWDVAPDEGRVCRAHCLTDGECGEGEFCRDLGGASGLTPGICIPSCSPFEPRCAEGLSCMLIATATTEELSGAAMCFPTGPTEQGEVCDPSVGCVAGLGCVPGADTTETRCYEPCDAEHPCSEGECTFDPSGLFDEHFGFCRD